MAFGPFLQAQTLNAEGTRKATRSIIHRVRPTSPDMHSLTGNRKVSSTERLQAFSVYVDHSQDPITDVLPIIGHSLPKNNAPAVTDHNASDQQGSSGNPRAALETALRSHEMMKDDQSAVEEFRIASTGNRQAAFPWVLYGMLEDCIAQGTDNIISWCEHGRSFQVHDRKKFETRVMPK